MIIIFDLDSTLVTIEGMDEIAKWKGSELAKKIEDITTKTMAGEMNFEEAFPKKIETLAPSLNDVKKLGELYKQTLVEDLIPTLETLRSNGVKLGVATGNFEVAMNILCDFLEFPKEFRFANKINFNKDGSYSSFNRNQTLAKDNGKALIIQELKQKHPNEVIYFIGDSVGDMKTQGIADKFIGFGGIAVREKVKAGSKHFIHNIGELLSLVD